MDYFVPSLFLFMFAFLNNIRYHNGENNYLGCPRAEIIPIEPALVNTSEGRFSDINLIKLLTP